MVGKSERKVLAAVAVNDDDQRVERLKVEVSQVLRPLAFQAKEDDLYARHRVLLASV